MSANPFMLSGAAASLLALALFYHAGHSGPVAPASEIAGAPKTRDFGIRRLKGTRQLGLAGETFPTPQPTDAPFGRIGGYGTDTPTPEPTDAPFGRTGGYGTDTPTPEPTDAPFGRTGGHGTASPTPEPTIPPTKPPLDTVGNNGQPEDKFPLGTCLGDCDSDNECAGDLVCFTRDGTEEVPGCSGVGIEGNDYCIVRPYETYLAYVVKNGEPVDRYPLGVCEGHCLRDSDCADGLVCYKRSYFDPVPGCDGAGTRGKDYCIVEG